MGLCRCAQELLATASHFIGGSDARIIMGGDETALIRLWQEKRGEARAGGSVRRAHRSARARDRRAQSAWYERNSGHRVSVQRQAQHSIIHHLDGGHS